MVAQNHYFPFGELLKKVVQIDRTSKRVFILGVYASAVHARWIGPDGKTIVAALAVASEPEIFWTGNNAEEIIKKISIPKEAGYLEPATLNGPSGSALDRLYLEPLGLKRSDTWLCDLIPESRLNLKQFEAINNHYKPAAELYNLPAATMPHFRKSDLNSEELRERVLTELLESKAEFLILLGDMPINYFLYYYCDTKHNKLSSFISEPGSFYGKLHKLAIAGKSFKVLPLCHPRQAQRLGASSKKWYDLHQEWISNIKKTE